MGGSCLPVGLLCSCSSALGHLCLAISNCSALGTVGVVWMQTFLVEGLESWMVHKLSVSSLLCVGVACVGVACVCLEVGGRDTLRLHSARRTAAECSCGGCQPLTTCAWFVCGVQSRVPLGDGEGPVDPGDEPLSGRLVSIYGLDEENACRGEPMRSYHALLVAMTLHKFQPVLSSMEERALVMERARAAL